MKKYLFIIMVMAVAILSSCKEDSKKTDPVTPDPPAKDTTLADFVGVYDLSIDYIFRGTDDEEPSYGSWTGTMTIEANGENSVKVTSNIEIKSGSFLDLYNTTGTLNEKKQLVLAPNTYDNGAMQFDLTYDPITYGETLYFESEMYTEIGEYPTTYEITNVATKKK